MGNQEVIDMPDLHRLPERLLPVLELTGWPSVTGPVVLRGAFTSAFRHGTRPPFRGEKCESCARFSDQQRVYQLYREVSGRLSAYAVNLAVSCNSVVSAG
jgi:hypothetical protein